MSNDHDPGSPGSTVPPLRALVAAGVRLRHTVARTSGLSETELVALEHLAARTHGPADLARLLEVSTAAATGIVDRLAGRGHVERRPHPQDRRRTEVHLTDSGRAELWRHLRTMIEQVRAVDAGLTPEEREVVVRYLAGATAAIETVTGPPPSIGPAPEA